MYCKTINDAVAKGYVQTGHVCKSKEELVKLQKEKFSNLDCIIIKTKGLNQYSLYMKYKDYISVVLG